MKAIPSAGTRLLMVSNRLPVRAWFEDGVLKLDPTSGGVAMGLGAWHGRSGGLWIGWPGDASACSPHQRRAVDDALRARGIVGIHLSASLVEHYYHGFANRVIWPLFHYLVDRVPVDATGWEAYRDANIAFAEAIVREYRPGDLIWVHDYQLMLVPALVRERLPEASIGFFLHIPFPSSEVFRVFPWRREVLDGLLAADLVGFHTHAYLRHFIATVLNIDGVKVDVDHVRVGDHSARVAVFPMGVDAVAWAALAGEAEVDAEAAAIRRDAGARRILLGVDRLDYTKGIPRRLLAVERLLKRNPSLRDRLRYVQVAVPSRVEVDAYQAFRRQVEETVGRINGSCATVRSTPIHYIHGSVSRRQLAALYRAADVMVVTPLRDGMNLVAKEYIASRTDEDGVLVLSEFAGAAAELGDALLVNPYDVDGLSMALERALDMPPTDRRRRMRNLRRRVFEYDVQGWAEQFVEALADEGARARTVRVVAGLSSLSSALTRARQVGRLRVLLDYDGTLVPIAAAPELAAPDAALIDLLWALSASSSLDVELVSGLRRETLDAWFGHLPLALWAEHGFWHRPRGTSVWQAAWEESHEWMRRLGPLLEQFAAATPGARVETKSASLAWHFRETPSEFGQRQAQELRLLLRDMIANQPLEIIEGKKVLEVRRAGFSTARVAQRFAEEAVPPQQVLAIGDDRTDDELFAALPPAAHTVAVGRTSRHARYRLDGPEQVRDLLASLLDGSRPLLAGSPASGAARLVESRP